MAGLGLVLGWSGYLLAVWGFTKIKSAYNPAGALTIADLALPSHRVKYITAMTSNAMNPNAPYASNPAGAPGPGKTQPGLAGVLGNAQAARAKACAGAGAGSAACPAAKAKEAQIQAQINKSTTGG